MTEHQQNSSAVCHALRPFGTSIFTEMTALAVQAGAINLSQGFPDFEGPKEIRKAAAEAILRGPNQYVPSHGIEALRNAIAHKMARSTLVLPVQGNSFSSDKKSESESFSSQPSSFSIISVR